MKNLVDVLCAAGFPAGTAKNSLVIIYQWIDEHYPVMAALAKATVLKEAGFSADELNDQPLRAFIESAGSL